MDNNYKYIIDYLNSLKDNKEKELETRDFSNVPSVAMGLEYDIKALKTVIDIIKEESSL